ncbi:MAG: efflux RND transporter periplasmic adaptor subunit [Candidatus Theseobacter exili]|nr:efflux RND transporter periplasmic adaptor subunit [Candidatus Theseobacter exili]
MRFLKKVYCIGISVSVALCLVSCSRNETPEQKVIRPVVTIQLQEPTSGRKISFSGTAKAALETVLSFRVSGEIRELPAKPGNKVQKGDVIAKLDTTDYELQANQSKAQLNQTEAQFKQAKAEYERSRSLYEAGNLSKSDLDGAQASFESAKAQKDANQKSLMLSRQQLKYCTLKAPVDGYISSVPVEVYTTIQAGQTIATVDSGKEMKIKTGIPEAIIGQITKGKPAVVSFESVPGTFFDATICEVGITSSESGTYSVELLLKKMDNRIKSGMVGEATFLLERSQINCFVVPAVAIASEANGTRFVWIYQPSSSTVKKRTVEVGSLTTKGLEVIKGISPGDIIVIRGVHRLNESQKVRLQETGKGAAS